MYIIPKQLREEYKIFNKPCIFLKDVFAGIVFLGVFYLFKNFVHSWLLIPYWIFAATIIFFMIQPAKGSNPKKRNWEALLLFIGRDRTTYRSINHVQEVLTHDEQR